MKPGQHIMVNMERPIFTDDGLFMEPYERPARFIEHTPKPWEPEACKVDYGNGSRKCCTLKCRKLHWRERVPWRALAEALRNAGF